MLLVSDLYRRTAPEEEWERSAGSLPGRERMNAMLQQVGFDLEHWEDRTPDLRRLVAQLIMAGGAEGGGPRDCCGNSCSGKEFGYHLLAARKSA